MLDKKTADATHRNTIYGTAGITGHTSNLVTLLSSANISLLLSSPAANSFYLICSRAGELVQCSLGIDQPRAVAAANGRIALAAGNEIYELFSVPAALAMLDPSGGYDACFITHKRHITGRMGIQDMAWCQNELWLASSRYSCLATLDSQYSFAPRWLPPFITQFIEGDRCHLSGLAVRDGVPRYATALAESDHVMVWDQHRTDGGVLVDIATGRCIVRNLCMPFSPRWHAGELWVLEAGKGALLRVDSGSGHFHEIIRLPGFARGLAFFGHLAFIGLSQLPADYSLTDLPVTADGGSLMNGIAVVNVELKRLVALLRFGPELVDVSALELIDNVRCPYLAVPQEHPELHAQALNLPRCVL
ncbi:MAG: TIGR03032 family protein [Parahaliea sp.]